MGESLLFNRNFLEGNTVQIRQRTTGSNNTPELLIEANASKGNTNKPTASKRRRARPGSMDLAPSTLAKQTVTRNIRAMVDDENQGYDVWDDLKNGIAKPSLSYAQLCNICPKVQAQVARGVQFESKEVKTSKRPTATLDKSTSYTYKAPYVENKANSNKGLEPLIQKNSQKLYDPTDAPLILPRRRRVAFSEDTDQIEYTMAKTVKVEDAQKNTRGPLL